MKSLVVIAFSLSCAGCARSGVTPIVVYSPHGKEMLTAFAGAFEKDHPSVAVKWLDMGSQVGVRQGPYGRKTRRRTLVEGGR